MSNNMDNLKNAWKTITESGYRKEYSSGELMKIVRKKSNNELTKIRRKLIIEWALSIILSLFIVVFIKIVNNGDTIYALTFVGLILIASFFPYLNIMRIKSDSQSDLKSYLKEFIGGFERLIDQYLKIATILMPITVAGGTLLGVHSSLSADEWSHFFETEIIIILVFLVGFLSFGAYWFLKKYFGWNYGKNLKRLKDCLADLEKANEIE